MSPFLVAVVAFAEDWMYENGVLCYLSGRQLRVLDLHRPGTHEIVVDTRKLLRDALRGLQARRSSHHRLRLLHHSHGIVSCVYGPSKRGKGRRDEHLVAFNPLVGQIVATRRLESVSKLFVRNNDRFLYYGTTSAPGADGYERWVLTGCEMATSEWFGPHMVPAVIGTDVGSSVCFEIFDKHLYVLSTQTSLELEVVDWVSYYLCFRVPLACHGFDAIEALPREQFWRRNQIEGPIDDRWSFTRLFKDETTGELRVVECRKEWLSGRISARRTYYTTAVSFDGLSGVLQRQNPGPGAGDSEVAAGAAQQATVAAIRNRDPNLVHPGDDTSAPVAPLSKCPVRSYHPSSQAFLDLVDDSDSFDPADQRLRIRGGSRRPRTPGELAQLESSRVARGREHKNALARQMEDLYVSRDVCTWPPEPNPCFPDPALGDLYAILNPPGHVGNVHGCWDERSMVYGVGGMHGGPQALVFVSYDPSISLDGTPPYPGDLSLGGTPAFCRAERCPSSQPDTTSGSVGSPSPKLAAGGVDGGSVASWRGVELARYRQIGRGYHFAR